MRNTKPSRPSRPKSAAGLVLLSLATCVGCSTVSTAPGVAKIVQLEKCVPPPTLLQDRPEPKCRLRLNDDLVACLEATRGALTASNADKAALRQWAAEACF
jgi:hypothetical protein